MALPIEAILPRLLDTLRTRTSAIVTAEPGAGKTTRVPLALLGEPWLEGKRILLLEPRRIAARAAARFMAASLGEQVGGTVGYRVKSDTRVSAVTRIEVVTEGVLTRLLQADPALDNVGAVLFDEFHERSLHADLGLALCLQAKELLRDDLRIVLMSATLDADRASALLGDAPVIHSEGRMFPVDTVYAERPVDGRIEPAVARTIRSALQNEKGDLLVFLPGAGEIRRVETLLADLRSDPRIRVAPLYGNLSSEAQDAAIAPSPPGIRKIVLATSIAETSLTVEGVRIIVDSGLMRVPRFSPRTGMTRLETVKVSRASADQRRGRAGRVEPGVCYRLWTEQEERQLAPHSLPEIAEADLAQLALELAVWGSIDPSDYSWLDVPPSAAYSQAMELLGQLGALDGNGKATPHGKRMAEFGVHPRIAHMLLEARQLGDDELRLACMLAVLLSDRDPLRVSGAPGGGNGLPDADLRLRVEALAGASAGKRDGYGEAQREDDASGTSEAGVWSRMAADVRQLERSLGLPQGRAAHAPGDCGRLLAFAYPDRIAQRKGGGRYLLRNGRGAALDGPQPIGGSAYLVAAELDDRGADSRILLAAPLEAGDLEAQFAGQIEELRQVAWDAETQSVRGTRRLVLGSLTLRENAIANPEPEEVTAAFVRSIAEDGLDCLPWTRTVQQFRLRVEFMRRFDPQWPDLSDEALLALLPDWLGPHLSGMKRRSELQRLKLSAILEHLLTWEQRRQLDECAPTHYTVPSGSRIPIDYGDTASPVLAVRLQELFGLADTPSINRGRVALVLHLLSPAQRPVQVTRDLASFWRDAYFEVKKDLKGRYPKHYWPDDPLSAMPTSRARPRPN